MPAEFTRGDSSPLKETIDMIEKLLNEWNIPPETVKGNERNIWYLTQGSASFHIELFKYNKGGSTGEVDCIEVGGIVMKLPRDNFLPLYRRLLDLNATAVGVYFAVRGNFVMLLSTKEIIGMDYNEFKTMVDEVRHFADYWDDILMKEFNCTK